jgi:hypothetical protein
MKNKFLSTALILATIVLTGCHFIPDDELYNNTGSDIVITAYTLISNGTYEELKNKPQVKINQIKIQLGTHTYNYEIERTFTLKTVQSTTIGVPYKIKIQRGNQIYCYDIKWIPYGFYKSMKGSWRIARLQIQQDGLIYLLSPETSGIVTNFPPQPPDFPLHPKSE